VSANPAKAKLAAGEFVLCMSLRLVRSADAALIAQAAGFDALYIDLEHAAMTIAEASNICIAAAGIGLTPLIRVKSPADIAGALDAGAHGVIVPHVSSAADAAAAVRNAKFPSAGSRSVSVLNPAMRYQSLPLGESIARQNELTMVIAMIETPAGAREVDAIAAVPGIDVIMIGPNDLSAELGIPGKTREPAIRQVYERAGAACRKHGKALAANASGGPDFADVIAMGARFIVGSNDVGYLLAGARQGAASIRESISSSPKRSQ
jgi:2-keto-3-deoxy-L-rhamnonate aldolase RhmA